ncbi:cytosolic carboxypeptidase 2 isoform X1 [Apis mellifera]|uniref:Cytosolic carboxypeptidase 2 isoform X1 n=1 Tax=Apis mellifera TaxID=7460 RepID=A0A7M7IN94_APIME|nr:cytosolic carboxypeptidase 2 isoform X1 [Apis mellifera]|eukprot:XP_016772529.2 cytosolic carboxypeptidase 2 isoform X1 [Apis mellifera]
MKDLSTGSKVKELQAMLFPIQPVPGNTLANLKKLQELQLLQLGQCEIPRRETELSLFSIPFGSRDNQSQETLRNLLDTHCIIDGITREAARWPTECEVLPERVRHIEYAPFVPEPFYVPTGKEPKPKPLGDELGTVIFRYHPTGVTSYFSRSCVGGNTVPTEFPTDLDENESKDVETSNNVFLQLTKVTDTNTDLHFESRFESGNLCKVVKITDTYYQLYLRKDLYTQRHTQWYYFRISNTRSRTNYRLSIVNLSKEESLYNEGLRPLLYSIEDAKKRAVGWRRCGENIAYYRNDSSSDEEKEKHTLTFNISFPHDRDTVYLAHCYPYTYTDLQEYLSKLVADPIKSRYTKLRLLCRTLAGNGVYYLTITAPTYEEVQRKRGIVITARVHPGETPSSWTMKGIIDFLTGESNQARVLRERFVFKLVPMLNPDGVIVGNNRCSLSGRDLNRQYRTVMRESYPSIWHTKLMIRRLLEECGVAIYCDLHAHSRKHNIFIYGCESKKTASHIRLSEQVFPLMLHKNAADKFSFENCKFHMEKGKEGTGRVVVWSMGVQNSYTMEASMGGTKIGSRSGTHFSTQDYEQIGRVFCETLLDFFDPDPVKERLRNKIIIRLMKGGSSAEEPTNIDLTDYSSDEGNTSDNSISEEEEEIGFSESTWTYSVRQPIVSPQYLCAPPPTPTFVPLRSLELTKRRSKKGTATNKTYYLRRRKMLTRRAVMDLPTTDPGSDFCEYNDSADEESTKQERCSAKILGYSKEDGIQFMQKETDDSLVLPEIARSHSISLDENFSVMKEKAKTNNRESHCLRLVRTLRHRSPVALRSQDIQIKLSSLRQQIWMGVTENIEKNIALPFVREPLSWGISNMALRQDKTDSEALLKRDMKKLQFFEYFTVKSNTKEVQNKYKHKKSIYSNDTNSGLENQLQSIEQKPKKKKVPLKWQKMTNSRMEEMRHGKTSFLTIKADSLKLVTLEMPSKVQTRQLKNEYKRKHRKSDSVSNGGKISTITKSEMHLQTHPRSHIQLQPLIVPLCDSFSSDDSANSHAQEILKKKCKKKKQSKKIKSTAVTGKKKRAISANTLRNA